MKSPMNSLRLYYEDAYTCEFTAGIVAQVQANGRYAVILDHTFFYPTSGGQPHDTGLLGETAVTEVTLREADGAILHWLDAPLPVDAGRVNGRIHWPRRFDHMQQHSGQHILSQALLRVAGAATASFHLSADSVTIDLAAAQLTPEQLTAAEELANQIIWQNRPILIRQVSLAEAEKLNLRKIPEAAQGGTLRLVEITDFDLTACGGTHVASTGAVGLIKILKVERMRGQVRVVFCCGGRALADYRQKHEVLQTIAGQLTTSLAEFPQAIQTLQEALKQANRTYKQQTEMLLALEAEQLRQQGIQHGPYTLIIKSYADKEAAQLRILANQLTQQPGTTAFLGLAGERSFFLFSRAADAPGHMNDLLQKALQELGGRGGGTAVTAQGGGPPANEAQIRAALEQAKDAYCAQLASSLEGTHNDVK